MLNSYSEIQKDYKKKKIEENENETHMRLEKENKKDTTFVVKIDRK